MKRILFAIFLFISVSVVAQEYILQNEYIVKQTKTFAFKDGKYVPFIKLDTVGYGNFFSDDSIPSVVLKAAVDSGYVEFVDTVKEQSNVFFAKIIERKKIITRDGDGNFFEVDTLSLVAGKEWRGGMIFSSILFLVCLTFLFSKKFKRNNTTPSP